MDLSAADRNALTRLMAGRLAMLRATAGAADAFREQEDQERQIAAVLARRTAGRAAREGVAKELHELRSVWQARQSTAHGRELAVRDLMARREALVLRVQEDYGLAIDEEAASQGDAEAELPNPQAAQQEIDELRKKLTRLGSVNMEALEELTRVEGEAKDLHAQHDDLARRSGRCGRSSTRSTPTAASCSSRR